jgi:hypothetical protein
LAERVSQGIPLLLPNEQAKLWLYTGVEIKKYCGSRKSVDIEIIDDFQIRVKSVTEGQCPVDAA